VNIFVTGGTGFVGGHFVTEAVARGHSLTLLKREGSQPRITLPTGVIWHVAKLDKIHPRDIAGADVLVHFASVGVSPQRATWDELHYWNVASLLGLLQSAKAAGVRKIVIAGTCMEYGLSADEYASIPVTAALKPTTPYAASKASAFELSYAFCLNNSIPLAYNRIFFAYGVGQFQGNFWPSLRAAALAGADFPMTAGEQVRDFVPIRQIAEEFTDCVEADRKLDCVPVVSNVCTGVGVSVIDFARYWWKRWHAKGVLLPGALQARVNEPVRFVGIPSRLQ
jgi:nucleoside-diphosphate-sugar epimerase